MKNILISIRLLMVLSVLTGLIYPLAIQAIAQIAVPFKANGQLLIIGDKAVGSVLISQKFSSPKYFWSRPSAIDFNPLPSGGSNLGQASLDLEKHVDARRQALKALDPQAGEPPQELLFASASGLDPHLGPAAIDYQVSRVAKARGLEASQVRKLVEEMTETPQLGILGEARVNVLMLNLALDQHLYH